MGCIRFKTVSSITQVKIKFYIGPETVYSAMEWNSKKAL